jgi:hypothetical protein
MILNFKNILLYELIITFYFYAFTDRRILRYGKARSAEVDKQLPLDDIILLLLQQYEPLHNWSQ